MLIELQSPIHAWQLCENYQADDLMYIDNRNEHMLPKQRNKEGLLKANPNTQPALLICISHKQSPIELKPQPEAIRSRLPVPR